MFYLIPYGSTQPENLESITDNLQSLNDRLESAKLLPRNQREIMSLAEGPLLLFYDQEPILGEFNYPLFDDVANRLGPHVIVTTEKQSDPLDSILSKYQWKSVYYFHHAFAAHDWYRGYRYDARLIEPKNRNIKKKFITFNRITSATRVYRTLLISELAKRTLLEHGHVSYSDVCPVNGCNYVRNLADARESGLITQNIVQETINTLNQIEMPLRIDYEQEQFIPNGSFELSAIPQSQESFCYLVTETCYWERKHHLTEKIFKPIVSKMPFVLVGPAHNLKYLREYGFKTFDRWIDESYDDIEDPLLRMEAIGETMSKICAHTNDELSTMLEEMTPILEHNFNLFYSNEFLDGCWGELLTNIRAILN